MKKIIVPAFCAVLGMISFSLVPRERGLVIVGLGYDDGKGKFIDSITEPGDVVVRVQGAGPSGRLVKIKDCEYQLSHIPVGILREDVKCYLGGGMILDCKLFFKEIEDLKKKGIKNIEDRLRVSTSVHLLMDYHKEIDKLAHKAGHVRGGTILREGVRPCSAEKRFGIGIRLADLFSKDFPELLKSAVTKSNEVIVKLYNGKPIPYKPLLDEYTKYIKQFAPYVRDHVELKLNRLLAQNRGGPRVIFEGSHGTFLDISHGSYPYVSTGSTIASGICAEAGVGPTRIGHTLGVVKAYATRPGEGPFPTEIKDAASLAYFDETVAKKSGNAKEVRYGWLDGVMIRQGIMINGANSIAITRLDELNGLDEIKMCIHYKLDNQDFDYLPPIARDLERVKPHYVTFKGWKCPVGHARNFSELPAEARDFIKKIERVCGIPVSYVSVGPERDQLIEVVAGLLPEGCNPPVQRPKKPAPVVAKIQGV